jgi:hypothetical protein
MVRQALAKPCWLAQLPIILNAHLSVYLALSWCKSSLEKELAWSVSCS